MSSFPQNNIPFLWTTEGNITPGLGKNIDFNLDYRYLNNTPIRSTYLNYCLDIRSGMPLYSAGSSLDYHFLFYMNKDLSYKAIDSYLDILSWCHTSNELGISSSIITIHKLLDAHATTQSVLIYPGFTESCFRFNNNLEALLRAETEERFAYRRSVLSLAQLHNKSSSSAAVFTASSLYLNFSNDIFFFHKKEYIYFFFKH